MTRSNAVLMISGERATVVAAAGDDVRIVKTVVRPSDAPWSTTCFEALSGLNKAERRRARLLVGLDEPRCRERALFGVSPTAPLEEVERLLGANPDAFFVGDPASLVVGGATLLGQQWRALALERDAHAAVRSATDAAAVRVVGLCALPADSPADDFASLARRLLHAKPTELVIFDPDAQRRETRNAARRRLVLLSALLLALVGAAAAPSLVVASRERALAVEEARLRRDLERLAPTHGPSSQALALIEASRSLRQGEAAGVIIARIAAALPESAAISSIRIDSAEARVSILAPPRVDVVAALARLDGLEMPRLTGALARESVQGVALQRTTLTLAISGRTRRPAVALTGRR